MTDVHQVLLGATDGDAITSMALDVQRHLRRRGPSEVFALHRHPSVTDRIRPLHELPYGRPRDLVIYHSSYGDPAVTRVLLDRPERLVLAYHNITPSRYFVELDPSFAQGLEWARHELTLLRDRTVLAVADSTFNAADLTEIGYRDVHVVPAGVVPDRLRGVAPDRSVVRTLAERFPDGYVAVVAQLLPHKRVDVVIQAVHLLRWTLGRSVGLVIVGASRLDRYAAALRDLARRLRVDDTWFAGRLDDAGLAAVLSGATVFVSASEHEGLGIPPLEAMSLGIPTVVRDAGATRETVGDGSLVLPANAGPAWFAEAIDRVRTDARVRSALVRRGLARVDHLVAVNDGGDRFAGLIAQVS